MTRDVQMKQRAATPIDVLMVGAVGGLLVLLLLPCVTQVRDEAQLAQCVQNMNALGRASLAYIADYDTYPIYPLTGSGTMAMANWSHAGQSSSSFWGTPSVGTFYVSNVDRPLNEYLLGAPPEPDVVAEDVVVSRTPMPQMRCPADASSGERSFGTGEPRFDPVSGYDDVGTSYLWNMVATEDTNIEWWQGDGAATVGREMIRNTAAYADVFVLNFEDNADVGFPDGSEVRGNHGELNRHAVQFRDGHAAYILMDTREDCGPGWTAIVPQWVYERGMNKPVYYPNRTKNCYPR